jgi:hypothetical protein
VCGGIRYVVRPLYDYVQHGDAVLGYEGANQEKPPRLPGLARLKTLVGGMRVSYFFAFCRLRVLAETLVLRGGDRIGRRARRTLTRFAGAERSASTFAWIAVRRLRAFAGRTETLDAERVILRGILWPRGIAALGRLRDRPLPGITYDASPPPPPPDAARPEDDEIEHLSTRALAALVEPLRIEVDEGAPERVNLLIPTIDLRHLFGGYIAKFNLALKLAERGHRVRIVTVDPTPALAETWREEVEAYAGLERLFERVEVALARDGDGPLTMNPGDALIATTWWTAHVASAALRDLRREGFLYMVQEFEPYTRPLGSWSALAMSTYSMPHKALFSTRLLQDYFAARGYGVYASGREAGDRDAVAFENAITAVAAPSPDEMAARERRRLLFYARPEPHGARNMFELGFLALRRAVAEGIIGPDWEIVGIGSVEGRDRNLDLGDGRVLRLLSKRDQAGYAELLAAHDVGLALMYTPHPSLVPLEMASAGMVTVTNRYETKTPEAMSRISANILAVEGDLDGIVDGLREAVARSDDFQARASGSQVAWSTDWDRSFDEAVMERVEDLLART